MGCLIGLHLRFSSLLESTMLLLYVKPKSGRSAQYAPDMVPHSIPLKAAFAQRRRNYQGQETT
jgi:hypothetical protein